MSEEPEYMTVQAAAELLGVTRRRLWDLIRAGQLEAVQNPLDRREKLIPREEVDRLARFANIKKAVA